MNWIEQILHFDPDNGNGTVELGILLFLAVGIVMVALRARGRVVSGKAETIDRG